MHIAKEQADFLIIQLARQLKHEDSRRQVVVLSCDYDFIALAPPNSVDMLLDPTRRIAISKSKVLELLGVDEQAVFLGYTVGGCDDIATNLIGVGFHRALKVAKKYPVGRTLNTALILPILRDEFREEKEATLVSLANQIQDLQRSLWTLQPQAMREFEVLDSRSMLEKFASEEDAEGKLRRESFFKLTERVSHVNFHLNIPVLLPESLDINNLINIYRRDRPGMCILLLFNYCRD